MSTEPEAPHKPFYQGPAFLMLIALIGVYLVGSMTRERSTASMLMNLLMIAVVLLGVRAVTQKPRTLWIGASLILGFTTFSVIASRVIEGYDYRWESLGTFVLGAMASVVFKTEQVSVDKIFAAACVYMLMGICFGLVYTLIEQGSPGSFSLTEADLANLSGSLIHFSFTTLTTVGYGNISPLSPVSRSLADMEAVLAQLYLAIVLARLVSLQITYSKGK